MPQVALCLLKNLFSRSILVSPMRSSDPSRSQSNTDTERMESCGKVASNSKNFPKT